jgi:hypothetical protein
VDDQELVAKLQALWINGNDRKRADSEECIAKFWDLVGVHIARIVALATYGVEPLKKSGK